MTDVSRRARWHGGLVVTLVVSLLAVVLGVPSLLFLGVVAFGFVLLGEVSSVPTLEGTGHAAAADGTDVGLRLERALSQSRIRPGQPVRVTLSVTNESDGVASDVRIVDDPPADVPVTDGSPAFATAIRPGETVTHEYELTPPRGEYAFGTATVRRRSLSATAVATDEVDPEGDAAFTCETLLDTFPFRDQTIQYVGQTPTDDGGSGVEFFATREYRRGDPMNRIDWHRFARTGDLATVEYREERAVTIVFVIDDRTGAHRALPGGGPDSYDLTLYAASRGVVASIEGGNRTGLATLSGETWIEPGGGTTVRRLVETAIDDAELPPEAGDTAPVASADRPLADGGERAGVDSLAVDLERRLPPRTQVVFCTPLTDGSAVDLVETLRTRGRAVTVVSPDVTTGVTSSPSYGMHVAGLERTNRVDALRGLGATVVDWHLDDPLAVDLARAFRVDARRSGGGAT